MEEEYKTLSSELSECKVAGETDISKSFSSLEKDIDKLEKIFNVFYQKLSPILKSEQPQEECTQDRAARNTEISESIQQKSDRLGSLNKKFEVLLERIDL